MTDNTFGDGRPRTWQEMRDIAAGLREDLADDLDEEAARIIVAGFEGGDERAFLQVMLALAADADNKYEREQAGHIFSTYIIHALGPATLSDGTKIRALQPIYVGRTKNLGERERIHRQSASKPSERAVRRIAAVIHELRLQDADVYFDEVASGLTLDQAKVAEARLIQMLSAKGAPLANTRLHDGGGTGVTPPAAPGTPEYLDQDREYKRQVRSTPEGRAVHMAREAIKDLKKGGSLTDTRRQHIITAGPEFVEKANAVLSERGEPTID